MEKADPCARSGVILFGSCSLPQILGTNGLVVVWFADFAIQISKPRGNSVILNYYIPKAKVILSAVGH